MHDSSSTTPAVDAMTAPPATRPIGLWQIIFLVISAAAPLTGALGGVPPAISLGNGPGIPGAFIIAGLVLLVFSAGFASMSRHVVRAGAFYAYLAAGPGRPVGMAGAFIALLSYTSIQIALYGLFGFFCSTILGPMLHTGLPWYGYALACAVIVQFTGLRGIDLNSRVLGVLMCLELGILLLLSLAIVLHGGGPDGLTLAPFAPRHLLGGHVGIAVMFAFASFIGFEATAIYGQECRNPRQTVPRATYLSVILILVFFAFVTWTIVCAYGMSAVSDVAAEQPGDFWFIQSNRYLGSELTTTMSLLLSSIFASVLAFHNMIVRYIHALAGEGILPAVLERLHPKHGSPHVASYVQTISICIPLVVYAAAGADPFAIVFSCTAALGIIGVVLLQTATSFSVLAFFLATKLDTRIWHARIAPLASGFALFAIAAILIRNLDVLSGSDSPVVEAFPWIDAGAALAGIAVGLVLRRVRPEIYARFGQ